MSRNYGIKEIGKWEFEHIQIPQEWADHLGNLHPNFRMLITGPSGHGKTEYVMKLTKMLSAYYGKVHFNSTELGKSPEFKLAYDRNGMSEIEPGKFMLADKNQATFEPYFNKVQRPNSGRVLVIDSLDYMHLTFEQFQILHKRFPHKAIIIVAWSDPMSTDAKKIKYCCAYKVQVKDFRAKIISRFGGNKPFVIWQRQNGQLTI